MTVDDDGRTRCGWIDQTRLAPADFILYRDYHDTEWGSRCANPRRLFERISLEAFQSGLSWLIILRKRENFRRAFHGFDVERVARYTERDIDRLMADTGIVRNRAKIEATIANARAAADLDVDLGELLWSFAPPPRPRPADLSAGSRGDRRIDRDGQGIEAPRLPIRRTDDGLRVDAGHRNGRRPHRRLLGSGQSLTRRHGGLSRVFAHRTPRIGNNRGRSVRPPTRAGSCGGSTRWRR